MAGGEMPWRVIQIDLAIRAPDKAMLVRETATLASMKSSAALE